MLMWLSAITTKPDIPESKGSGAEYGRTTGPWIIFMPSVAGYSSRKPVSASWSYILLISPKEPSISRCNESSFGIQLVLNRALVYWQMVVA